MQLAQQDKVLALAEERGIVNPQETDQKTDLLQNQTEEDWEKIRVEEKDAVLGGLMRIGTNHLLFATCLSRSGVSGKNNFSASF